MSTWLEVRNFAWHRYTSELNYSEKKRKKKHVLWMILCKQRAINISKLRLSCCLPLPPPIEISGYAPSSGWPNVCQHSTICHGIISDFQYFFAKVPSLPRHDFNYFNALLLSQCWLCQIKLTPTKLWNIAF